MKETGVLVNLHTDHSICTPHIRHVHSTTTTFRLNDFSTQIGLFAPVGSDTASVHEEKNTSIHEYGNLITPHPFRSSSVLGSTSTPEARRWTIDQEEHIQGKSKKKKPRGQGQWPPSIHRNCEGEPERLFLSRPDDAEVR